MSLVVVDHQDMRRAIERELKSYIESDDMAYLVNQILNAIMDLDGKPSREEWRPSDGTVQP